VTDWIVGIEGTPAGRDAAMALALLAAVAHAAFGALQKGRHDPWLTRGAIDAWIFVLAAPAALFVVPWPEGRVWAILGGAVVIHLVYKLLMAMAYSRAAFTVVYPVVRGTGPLATVAFASVVFAERYTALQWLGVGLLSGGILALAAANLRGVTVGRAELRSGLAIAFAGGLSVAVYTTYDAWGIRATPDPFTFLAWFFFVTAVDFPLIAAWRYARMLDPPELGPLLRRGFAGAWIAFVSFGAVMLATRLDKVGQAAVLRETSVVFAALIGWLALGERVGPLRAALVAVIAAGAIVVEFGRGGGYVGPHATAQS
jgi:drug/metabolite transporter (DMT)-like permease